MRQLLVEVIEKHRPNMLGLVTSQNIELTDSELDEIFDVVGNEFCETGLKKNDEPNERGLLLEDLIGRLRRDQMIEKLKQIIASDGIERKKLIEEFQEEIWNGEAKPDNPTSDILSELAYDLDFYEPDEKLRSEDFSYYGDERLKAEIASALKKLEAVGNC